MANQLTKDLEIMFEDYIEGFDAACILSQEAAKFTPNPTDMQRAGDVFYRPQDYHVNVISGLDISAASPTDLIQRMVPTVFKAPQNVRVDLDAKELRDPEHKRASGRAAALRLAAQIDSDAYNEIAKKASNIIKGSGVFSWDHVASLEALMISKGMPLGTERKLFLNAFDYKDIAKELGSRQYPAGVVMDAYQRSQLPDIAGFSSFRTDNLVNSVARGTVTGTTVSGAQSTQPTAMTGDLPTDNRYMTLVVAGANIANIKNGDKFTIAGVNSVHKITKDDTGQLQTFQVISGGGTANLVVSPQIVATGPYQNVSAAAANGAALDFLNTVTKPANVAWAQGAFEVAFGKLAFPDGQGAQVMRSRTKNGAELIMSYEFNHLTGKVSCRFTTMYATTVLEPELCGVILANQT